LFVNNEMLLKKAFGIIQGEAAVVGWRKNSGGSQGGRRRVRQNARESETVPRAEGISLDDGSNKDDGDDDDEEAPGVGSVRVKGTGLGPVRLTGDAEEVDDRGYMIRVPVWVIDNPYLISLCVVAVLVFLCLVVKISSMGRELSRLSALVERLAAR
jgi:hypothetical protein